MKELVNLLKKHMPYTTREYLPKDIIFLQGTPSSHVFFIEQGWLRVSKYSEDGRDSTVDICGPGHSVGLVTLFREIPFPISTIAMSKVTVTIVEKDKLEQVLIQNPKHMAKVVVFLGKTVLTVKEVAIALSNKDAIEQIYSLFVHFALTYGVKGNDGWTIPFKLTYQYISDMLGLSRVTTGNCIKELEEQGLIISKGKKYTVLANSECDQLENYCKR